MIKINTIDRDCSEITWIIAGIPIIIIVGSLLHFVYEWSGNNVLIGLFSPINESVWEHLKLSFYPTLAWWILGYYIYKDTINPTRFIYAAAVALISAPLIITTLYYTYTGAIGSNSLIYDISIFIIAIIISQLLGVYTYRYATVTPSMLFLPTLVVLFLFIAFTVFTYNPPNIPLFIAP